jgi:tetratricopeptide (TPR) repeat protein
LITLNLGVALKSLAFHALEEGNYEAAEQLSRRQLGIYASTEDPFDRAQGSGSLGVLLLMLGQYNEAETLLEKAIATYQDLGARTVLAHAKINLAIIKAQLGKYEQAQRLSQQGIALAPELDKSIFIARTGLSLGPVALVRGAYTEAQQLLQKSVAHFSKMEPRELLPRTRVLLAFAERGLGNHAQTRQHLGIALQETRESRVLVALMHALALMALLLVDQSDLAQAVELYTLASNHPIVANSRWFEDVAGRQIAAVAATLPPEVVAAAQERGRARDLWATAKALLEELKK